MCKIILDVVMNETFLTIFCGVMVFVISQYIMEMIIKPRNELKKIKAKIIFYITMYDNYLSNPYCINKDNNRYSEYLKISNELRYIASELLGHLECYPIMCRRKKYNIIVNSLIKISNNIIVYNSRRDIVEENIELYNKICIIFKVKK